MNRVRRRLWVMAFNCVAVSAALLLVCSTLAFIVLTATAAQLQRPINPPALTAASRWHDVSADWQGDGPFAEDFVHVQ
jgi:hypothetical protein